MFLWHPWNYTYAFILIIFTARKILVNSQVHVANVGVSFIQIPLHARTSAWRELLTCGTELFRSLFPDGNILPQNVTSAPENSSLQSSLFQTTVLRAVTSSFRILESFLSFAYNFMALILPDWTLFIPPTRLCTVVDRAFLVSAARFWNGLSAHCETPWHPVWDYYNYYYRYCYERVMWHSVRVLL